MRVFHYLEPGAKVVYQHIQTSTLFTEELSHPLYVISSQADLKITKHLGRGCVTEDLPRALGSVGVKISSEFSQVYTGRILGAH